MKYFFPKCFLLARNLTAEKSLKLWNCSLVAGHRKAKNLNKYERSNGDIGIGIGCCCTRYISATSLRIINCALHTRLNSVFVFVVSTVYRKLTEIKYFCCSLVQPSCFIDGESFDVRCERSQWTTRQQHDLITVADNACAVCLLRVASTKTSACESHPVGARPQICVLKLYAIWFQ